MPTYVYRNLVTGETFEVQQRMTDDALTVHPETGDPVKRLIQPVGIAFKGSGFYVNDSRRSSQGAKSAGASESPSSGSASGGTASGGSASSGSADGGTASGGSGSASSASKSSTGGSPA